MRLIRPFDLAFSSYTTSVTEDDAPVWDAGTSYNLGDQVIRDHRVYVSTIVGTNTGIDPALENQLLTSVNWLLVGYTNAFRFVDKTIGNRTTSATAITIDVADVAGAEALMFFGVRASNIQIQGFDVGDIEVFNETFAMSGRSVFTFYQWFTEPIGEAARKLIVTDLPTTLNSLTMVISGGAIEIGEFVVGDVLEIGTAIMSDQTAGEVRFYGRVEFNVYGQLIQIDGPTRNVMQYLVHIPALAFPIIKDEMDRLAGTLIGAVASDTRQSANHLGFLGTIKWTENLPNDYLIQFNVEGTT